MNDSYVYQGNELDLFARADNWKKYFCQILEPYVHGQVLEVGSGKGTSTPHLISYAKEWKCLEPDASLAEESRNYFQSKGLNIEVEVGNIETVPEGPHFDCILYIDVLEHIENDGMEIRYAASRLKKGGFLVVLAPAHQCLFTPFDEAIGHYRRYGRKRLKRLTPMELRLLRACYVDSAGLLASLGNKLFLRKASPTEKQIQFWDKTLVPISKAIDPLLGYYIGKSIIGVWRKE